MSETHEAESATATLSSLAATAPSEIQHDAQCRINAAYLVAAEEPDTLAEPARVNCCGLLGKYPGALAADFDLGPKACRTSRR